VTAAAPAAAAHAPASPWLASRPLRIAVLAAGAVAGTVDAVAPYLSSHEQPVSGYSATTPASAAAHVAVGMSFILVGLYAWSRRPDNAVGALMCGAGFAFFLTDLGWIRTPATFIFADEWRGIFYAILWHLLLAFPGGRLASRFERVFVACTYAYVLAVRPFLSAAFFDPHLEGPFDTPGNPLLVRGDEDLNLLVDRLLGLVDLVLAATALVLVLLHWRRAGRHARRALTPVFAVAGVIAVPLAVAPFVGSTTQETLLDWGLQLMLALLPLGFLAGLLRTELARTAVADLVIRLQDTHDSRTLRDALAVALDDPSLEVGYWLPGTRGYVDAEGMPLALPGDSPARAVTAIESGGEPVAVLVHDASLGDEPELVDAVAAAARMALENQRLQAELRSQLAALRASRARIVAAGDAERRRLERDLHDGAQQRLLALGLALQLARAEVGEQEAADGLLAEAQAELRAALDELRDLARGIHPAILTDGGLEPALRTLAERAPFPVSVSCVPERLPAAVETAAYFVVSEALANVVKHAHAGHASVEVDVVGGRAVVVVADDGVGGAALDRGSGLRGLADRVQALEGTLEVESGEGGTRVRAVLPCG
jgi:signal transduction histidine kinase